MVEVLQISPGEPKAVVALKRMLDGLVREDFTKFGGPVADDIVYTTQGLGYSGVGKEAYIKMTRQLRRSWFLAGVQPQLIFGDDIRAAARVTVQCGLARQPRFETQMVVMVRVEGGKQLEAYYYTNVAYIVLRMIWAYRWYTLP